jgi:hypothetical protein
MNLARGNIIGGTFVMFVLVTACRHAAPTGADTGHTSFQVVESRRPPPPESSPEKPPDPVSQTQYREAQAMHPLVMPIYPRKALAAKAGAAQVGVRVNVDANGAVADIQPSMLAVNILPQKFADDFRDAVEVAVRQWKFKPARVLYVEIATEKGFAYSRVTRIETTEAEFDLSFTFTPSGKVEAGGAKPTGL